MKKILISIFSALLLGGISLPASAQAQGPADNEIWYTATCQVTPKNILGTGGAGLSIVVDESTFDKSTGIGKITFSGAVITIGESAFDGNRELLSVTIPASVKSIGTSAFNGCKAMTTVTFAEGSKLDAIGDKAFMSCSVLSSITIPASVKSIGTSAFNGCYDRRNNTGLDTVTFAEGSELESIGQQAFQGCTILSSITIPASVTEIGENAFYSCENLATVTFAEGSKLKSIGRQAFNGCKILSSITIPASVTSIGINAFYNCPALESINIPASVTEIGNTAFAYCRNLKSVTVNWTAADKIVQIDSNVFSDCPEGMTLLVPFGTEDLYAANESWSSFKDYMKPYITANQDPNNKKDYYATFYSSSKAYKLSTEDVTAYTGAVDGSVLKLKPIADGIIPAGEGVVLKLTSTDDTEAKVNILVEKSTEAGTKDTENVLTGTDTAIDSAPAGTKAFSLGESGVGFYLWTGRPIGAHKAYIPAATQE